MVGGWPKKCVVRAVSTGATWTVAAGAGGCTSIAAAVDAAAGAGGCASTATAGAGVRGGDAVAGRAGTGAPFAAGCATALNIIVRPAASDAATAVSGRRGSAGASDGSGAMGERAGASLGAAMGEAVTDGVDAFGVGMGDPADAPFGVGIAVAGEGVAGVATTGGGVGCACGAAKIIVPCCGRAAAGGPIRNVLPHFAQRIATPCGPTRESSIR
jgi:hypothetical protein